VGRVFRAVLVGDEYAGKLHWHVVRREFVMAVKATKHCKSGVGLFFVPR
jgi:hypothetical protein